MRLACETVVNEILPALRSLIAQELQEKGYTQTEIADLLDVTQPAVSQYLNASRGTKIRRIKEDDAAYRAVTELIDTLLADRGRTDLSREFCNVCATIRDQDLFDTRTESAAHLCLPE